MTPRNAAAAMVLSVAGAVWNVAVADDIPPCSTPAGVQVRAYPGEIPIGLKSELARRLGDVAAPGEPFDATDVPVTGRFRRIIFVWSRGPRWIVATERGGLGYNDPIFAFDLTEDGEHAQSVAERTAFPESVCSVASELLDAQN